MSKSDAPEDSLGSHTECRQTMSSRSRREFVVAAGAALLAGCGGSPDDPTKSPSGPGVSTDSPTSAATQSGTATSTTTDPTETPAPNPTATGTETPPPSELREVVLRLSDLRDGYELSGESDTTRSSASESQRQEFTEEGIVRRLSRSFTTTQSADNPQIVLSQATQFESAQAATDRQTELVSSFVDSGATRDRVEITSDIRAVQVTDETDSGLQNTVLYYQTGRLLLNLVCSGQETFFEERARKLLIKMVGDL
jgi:hypothetical protein